MYLALCVCVCVCVRVCVRVCVCEAQNLICLHITAHACAIFEGHGWLHSADCVYSEDITSHTAMQRQIHVQAIH